MTRGPSKSHNGKRGGHGFEGRFVGIPKYAYESPPFVALTPYALKLLIDMAIQYNGKNNGDLSAAWAIMEPRGWRSETTLTKAKRELLQAGFIQEMRKGRLPNLCSLYAISWFALNPNTKHDFGPNGFESKAFLKGQPLVITKRPRGRNAASTPESGVMRGS